MFSCKLSDCVSDLKLGTDNSRFQETGKPFFSLSRVCLWCFFLGSYKPCTHPHPPTLTYFHPHPAKWRSHSPTPTHTQPKNAHTHQHPPTPSQKKVTLTHTYPHPAKKRSHSPPPIHTQPKKKVTLTHTHPHPAKKGHNHPHSPTPTHKKVTLTHTHQHPGKKGHTQPKEGHTHPLITEIKNVTCLTHTYKYSLFGFHNISRCFHFWRRLTSSYFSIEYF